MREVTQKTLLVDIYSRIVHGYIRGVVKHTDENGNDVYVSGQCTSIDVNTDKIVFDYGDGTYNRFDFTEFIPLLTPIEKIQECDMMLIKKEYIHYFGGYLVNTPGVTIDDVGHVSEFFDMANIDHRHLIENGLAFDETTFNIDEYNNKLKSKMMSAQDTALILDEICKQFPNKAYVLWNGDYTEPNIGVITQITWELDDIVLTIDLGYCDEHITIDDQRYKLILKSIDTMFQLELNEKHLIVEYDQLTDEMRDKYNELMTL